MPQRLGMHDGASPVLDSAFGGSHGRAFSEHTPPGGARNMSSNA
jgi:hypothetical protein